MKKKKIYSTIFLIIIILLIIIVFFNKDFSITNLYVSKNSFDSFGNGVKNNSIPLAFISCSPSSPYNICSGWQDTYGTLTTKTQLNTYSNMQCTKSSNGNCIKRVWWGGKLISGDKLYYNDSCFATWDAFWVAANCDEGGCQLDRVDSIFEKTLVNSGGSYSGCPIVVAWDYVSNSEGYWVYSYSGYGYVGSGVSFVNLRDCYVDVDCLGGQICSSVGSCVVAECSVGQEKCVGLKNNVCNNGRWINQNEVFGKCGYSVSPSNPIIDLLNSFDSFFKQVLVGLGVVFE